jgi:hypothetical protein
MATIPTVYKKQSEVTDILWILTDLSILANFTSLNEREKEIVTMTAIEKKTYQEIAARLDISRERVRQLYWGAIRKIKNETLQIIYERRFLLESEKAHIELRKTIHKIEDVKPYYFRKVSDLGFSMKVLRTLEAAGIKTLGELIEYPKDDLLKFRNFGRKALTEVYNTLNEL